MMKRNYMAFCTCGGLVAIATADTTTEVIEHAKDARKWAEIREVKEVVKGE